MLYAFLGAIFMSVANVIGRYISTNFNIYKSLFIKYIFSALLGIILFLVLGNFHFQINFINIILFSLVGIFGYLGIWSYLKAMQKNNAGIVTIISFLYIFTSYFLNIWVIGGIEKFSIIKLILGILYFIIVSLLILEKGENKKIKINKSILFVFITIISWTLYYCLNNYIIKNKILDPIQMISLGEILVFIIAIIFFIFELIRKKLNFKKEMKLSNKQLLSYISMSMFTFIGALFYFLGYKYSSGNVVNFINLSGVILTSVIAWIFLKEKLNNKQITTMIFAITLLVLFVKF